MNLSEIRKKAQREREINGVPAVRPVEISGDEGADAEEMPEAQLAADPGTIIEPDGNLLIPAGPQEEPFPADFDPISVILAGRALACGHIDTGPVRDMDESGYDGLLCFRVATENYAVDIMEIREIIKPREVTEVPRVPSFITGIISLRGTIIPVFDMRSRLGHAVSEESGRERIIVVNKGEEPCGVLVDEVVEVARLDMGAIEPPPAVLEGIDRDFVRGIGRIDGRMLILLNLEKILDIDLH